MSRLFDRLGQVNISNGPAMRRWAQKLCEEVEEQFININASLADMPDLVPITVTADYTGTVEAGQLPRSVMATRFQHTTNVTTTSVWSFTVNSGSITATIGAATGAFTITALGSTSVVTISSLYGGVTKTRKLTVTKQVGAAPSTGTGGGTTATDTSFTSFNSTSMATVSDVLTVTTGTAGVVDLTAPLTVSTAATSPINDYPIYGIWQWDSTGGDVWVDLGTEVASNPHCTVYLDSDPSVYLVAEGAISVPYTKTGLAASSSQKFRLRARNSSGTRAMYLGGTATAIGS